jgi:(1->4)-alpha-D-glucan 1-alpha-D-glucosylmutase
MVSTVPLATYRLQLTEAFGFADAAALVPYLKELGISHLYASPFLATRAGSTHGYDIVDHARLNDELGGEAGFAELSNALRASDLGLILDFVPNHMAVGHADNAWWLDVLEWGEKSPHAASFDIDWHGLPYRTQPGVLLPILGRPYGDALQAGEIVLKFDAAAGSFAAWYFDHKLPINPRRYAEILRTVVAAAGAHDAPAGQALIGLAHEHRDPREPSYSAAAALKQRLADLPGAANLIAQGLHAYDGKHENSRLALHRLLERQNYRVAYWRVAFSAINYRRFFDINDLAAVRPERPATFMAMHVLVARLIAEGQLHGIRLDHIDGLWDPAQYTRRLTELIRRVRPQTRRDGFYTHRIRAANPSASLHVVTLPPIV